MSLFGIVIREQVRGPGSPSPVDAKPHSRVGLDVAHVARPPAVLGNDPEGVPLETVSDRVPSGQAGLESGRLEQRPPRHETGNPRDDRIDGVLCEGIANGAFIQFDADKFDA